MIGGDGSNPIGNVDQYPGSHGFVSEPSPLDAPPLEVDSMAVTAVVLFGGLLVMGTVFLAAAGLVTS